MNNKTHKTMNQQQNKRSTKNYKRNRIPARHIHTEYIAINNYGEIKADFNKEEEIENWLNNNDDCRGYIVKTYAIQGKNIITTQTIKNNKEE